MKVLIVGVVCSPREGTEPSNTWNVAWHLSLRHQVWVLTHPHDREGIENFLAQHPNANLRVHWIKLPKLLERWDPYGKGRFRFIRFHYLVWQRLALKKAVELHRQIGFDVAHHISWGTVSAPPPLWKLPVPLLWGPVGGGQRTPVAFRSYFGRLWRNEIIRNARMDLLPLSPSVRKAARSISIVLATNNETHRLLTTLGARDVRTFLDSGIPSSFFSNGHESPRNDGTLRLLWASKLQIRKALPLALEALAQVKEPNVRLLVAGDGEMRELWERRAEELGLQGRVQFLGTVPWLEMPQLYRSCDALLFTSLRDSFGSTLMEAMAHGLPILALDHQGVATFVPDKAAIKVPVTSPTETVSGLAQGIRRLLLCPGERQKMSEAALEFARTQTWEKRTERISKLYEEILDKRLRQRNATGDDMGDRGHTL
jgi:glycosyltransferase involved in cell wall biosynthesis